MSPSSRHRTFLAIAISVIALAIMVGTLWSQEASIHTNAERAERIASQLRCPFCNGESIADATAQVARDLEVVIGEKVIAGMSDVEIYQFFADRYGESLLLNPPLLGWGWALWALPFGGLLVGFLVVSRLRRRPVWLQDSTGPSCRELLASSLEAVAREQADIVQQLEFNELDTETGRSLFEALNEEQAQLVAALQEISSDTQAGFAGGLFRSSRALTGAAVLVVGAATVTTMLIVTGGDDSDGGIVDAPPIDLSSISTHQLEEVIAENPDIVEIRLFLAHMLMEEGEVLLAAQHFHEVLQREDNPEAMAWLGWISFLAGEHETAEDFLMDALLLAPDYPQAQWWLATVRFLGLDDPAGAAEPLEVLLASSGVPEEVRAAAQEMLDLARGEGS